MTRRAVVSIYQFPDHARHWFCWRGADSGVYAFLCAQCAEHYGEATLIVSDDSFSCDICNDFGWSDSDWQMSEEDEER